MGTEIYSFSQEHNFLFLLLYGLLILCGVGIVAYGLFFMPNKPCEFDGRSTKVRHIPVGFRIIMQGFPVLMGIACIVAGVINGSNSGKYYLGWHQREVLNVSGPVEEVYVQTDEDGGAEICFQIEGEKFALDFTDELAARFSESGEMTVQYGFSGDEKLIYFIHTAP